MSTKTWQPREEVLEAAMLLMSSRVDARGPGPHDDAQEEYAEDEMVKAAERLVAAKNLERREKSKEQKDTVGNPGEELLRRLSSAWATYLHLIDLLDEDGLELLPDSLSGVGGLLSAIGHDLAGTQGCLDTDEWEIQRRAHTIAYINSNSIAALPVPLADPPMTHRVKGAECPMGCGETLILAEGGFLTCTHLSCTNPTAAGEMLSPAARHQHQEEEESRLRIAEAQGKLIAELGGQARVLIDELGGRLVAESRGLLQPSRRADPAGQPFHMKRIGGLDQWT